MWNVCLMNRSYWRRPNVSFSLRLRMSEQNVLDLTLPSDVAIKHLPVGRMNEARIEVEVEQRRCPTFEKRASSAKANIVCIACGEDVLLQPVKLLPLPSESWSEIADFVNCDDHNHENDLPVRFAARNSSPPCDQSPFCN